MKGSDRLRRLASYALSAALVIAVCACSESHPNSTLVPRSDFGREIDFLWDRLLLLGTIVFVLTEGVLLYVVLKYRHRENQPKPPQTHGSTKLEITWTLIPAVILVFIAVPTVRTIVTTQAQAAPGSLNIDVTGHQWWWEFKYPEYGITTANEIYIPVGRTVNFRLRSADVIHSFWAPQLGGKRDVIPNRTNYVWLTPDSATASQVWNGFCAEYCGTAHTYMRFRVFTVSTPEFNSWAAGQKMPAQFVTSGYIFPRDSIPDYAVPNAPVPGGLRFTAGLTGNAHRGRQIFSSKTCIGCHAIAGNPMAMGVVGPNLTHFGSRSTLAAGLYPNTPAYLALWIKNARAMKPGVLMPALGIGEHDRTLKTKVTAAGGGLTDQEIADIVAYLTSLK